MIKHLPHLFQLSFREWSDDKASRLAAALAYYTIFSLAPLLVLVIAITGLLWQKDVVRTQILHQVQGLVGAQGAAFVGNLVNSKGTFGQGIFATIVGVITLILGALGVFGALQDSLNTIWDVEEKKTRGFFQGIKRLVMDRLISFTMVLGIGFLLLVSLVISTGLTAVQNGLANMLPFSQVWVQVINLAISVGVITVLFAFLFKFLPDAKIAWRDVWLGAFMTALLFSIGKTLIGLYLGSSNVASSYGAAGSLIILLLWIYYSAQIFFFGAEFTQVYANHYGSRIVPEANAVSTKQAGGTPIPERRPQPVPGRSLAADATSAPRRLKLPVPVTGNRPPLPHNVERENQKTVRWLAGMTLVSFLSGALATFFGVKKRR